MCTMVISVENYKGLVLQRNIPPTEHMIGLEWNTQNQINSRKNLLLPSLYNEFLEFASFVFVPVLGWENLMEILTFHSGFLAIVIVCQWIWLILICLRKVLNNYIKIKGVSSILPLHSYMLYVYN